MANINYDSDELVRYFTGHRERWDQFYPSERWIIDRCASGGGLGSVLDVGCATGGLGRALAQKGILTSYDGIEIHALATKEAEARLPQGLSGGARVVCGDIVKDTSIPESSFDTVFSLSCADWNIDTSKILLSSWNRVRVGGRLIISLRLTPGSGINDVTRSYESYEPVDGRSAAGERPKYNYVVFNFREALALLSGLPQAASLLGYGYWRKVSKFAVTPYRELVFSVFAVTRGAEDREVPSSELHLPLSLWTSPPA